VTEEEKEVIDEIRGARTKDISRVKITLEGKNEEKKKGKPKKYEINEAVVYKLEDYLSVKKIEFLEQYIVARFTKNKLIKVLKKANFYEKEIDAVLRFSKIKKKPSRERTSKSTEKEKIRGTKTKKRSFTIKKKRRASSDRAYEGDMPKRKLKRYDSPS